MDIIKGSDLMLFVTQSDNTVKSLAFATSHSLSISTETQQISTKDHGFWGATEVTGVNWSITTDNLYTIDTYNELFDMMMARQTIAVYFCLKTPTERAGNPATVNLPGDAYDTWHPTTTTGEDGYYGRVYITALDCTAQSGDNATFSCTLSGVGALTKGLYGSVEAEAGGSTDIVVDDTTYERASGAYDNTKTYYTYSNGQMLELTNVTAAEYNKQVLYVVKATDNEG